MDVHLVPLRTHLKDCKAVCAGRGDIPPVATNGVLILATKSAANSSNFQTLHLIWVSPLKRKALQAAEKARAKTCLPS